MTRLLCSMFALALGALAAPPALAHTSDSQFWTTVTATGRFDEAKPWLWSIEGHARFSQDNNGAEQTVFRPALGYRVRDGLDLWAGYARVTQHRDENNVEEERFWQQANYDVVEFAGGEVTGRTRVEQRFRESGDDVGWRFRQQFRFSRPIESTDVSAFASNEVFLTLNETDWGQVGGFDQNRAMLGVQWRVNDTVRIETGYMNQYSNRADGPDRVSHNLVLNATARF
ncbi:MAG: DUF2490 domain-containing protein [Hyphomonadaceae bacterium]|nr:DUF2490 domain-containing protein [Hyphomonadaceae bacterium]